jgi:hypothetical protein
MDSGRKEFNEVTGKKGRRPEGRGRVRVGQKEVVAIQGYGCEKRRHRRRREKKNKKQTKQPDNIHRNV